MAYRLYFYQLIEGAKSWSPYIYPASRCARCGRASFIWREQCSYCDHDLPANRLENQFIALVLEPYRVLDKDKTIAELKLDAKELSVGIEDGILDYIRGFGGSFDADA